MKKIVCFAVGFCLLFSFAIIASAEEPSTQEPSCEHELGDYISCDTGYHRRDCIKCREMIEYLEHTWDSFGADTITKAPTCKEEGERLITCTKCGQTDTRKVEKTKEHTYDGEWEELIAPTCTEKGYERTICTVCDFKNERTKPALGHDMASYRQTKAPTCTEKGEEESACSRCDHKEKREVKVLAHSFGEGKITKEPTEKDAGTRVYTCKACGAKKEEAVPYLSDAPVTEEISETEEETEPEGATEKPEKESEPSSKAPSPTEGVPEKEKEKGGALAVVLSVIALGASLAAVGFTAWRFFFPQK